MSKVLTYSLISDLTIAHILTRGEVNLSNRNRSFTLYSVETIDESIPVIHHYSVEELFTLIQSDISDKFDHNARLVQDIYPLHILNIRNIILRSSNTKDNNV